MIRKMVLSHDSANDVLQNTYIRIFKGIENFKEKSKLSTWIYRIAYNESIRFLTNESKLKKVELDSNDDNYSRKLYADEYFDAENLSLKFHQILSDLSLRQRNIFNMKYFDELKFSEISKITDWITVGAPIGDTNLLPLMPTFPTTSNLGNADLEIQIPTYSSTATSNSDDYVCFSIPTGLTQNREIRAIEVIPGNLQTVHHAIVSLDALAG